jgi:TonB family protein
VRARRGLFAIVVVASAALHVALAWMLPASHLAHGSVPPSIVEIADVPPPPPEPPPLPPREEAAPTARQAHAVPLAPARTTTHAASPAVAPTNDAPVDFTGLILSSTEGPGVALPGSSGASEPANVTTTTAAPASSARAEPPLVPASDLAKRPRAPDLDLVLERNYPADARRSGVSGSAVLAVHIHADGRVGAVRRVSETHAGFADACERTVRSGTWSAPIDRQGHAVATLITYTCRFEVRS